MEHEFIDEMFERLLAKEHKSYGYAFKTIVQERAERVVDVGRIENAYQLFRKKYPQAPENYFREYIKAQLPDDYEKCRRCFNWK